MTRSAAATLDPKIVSLNLDDPRLAAAAQRDPDVRNFLYWSRMPQVIDGRWSGLPQRPAFSGASPVDVHGAARQAVSRIHNSRVMSTRGEHLVHADRRFATGGGLLARLTAPAISKVLDEIDRRLMCGGIELTLPSGSTAPPRLSRQRAQGGRAAVELAGAGAAGDLGFGRLVQGVDLGEWSSPNPVAVFEMFSANAVALGEVGRAKGPFRWINASPIGSVTMRRARREEYRRALRSRQRFLFGLARRDDDLLSARFARPATALEDAQLRKISSLLDRLELKPGERLLDIGCGWGTLAIEAAKRGVSVVGLTLSTEQKAWAEREDPEAGLGIASKSACRITATPLKSSMPSRRSKWSRRSVSAGGVPISTASRAT